MVRFTTITLALMVLLSARVAVPGTVGCVSGGSPDYGQSSGDVVTFRAKAVCYNECDDVDWEATGQFQTVAGDGPSCPARFETGRITDGYSKFHIDGYSREDPVFGDCQDTLHKVSTASCLCSDANCDYNVTDDQINPGSPIIISIKDGRFELTSAPDGVHFDLNGDGEPELTAWTAPDSDEAFLALDRNLNGTIDDFEELFGDRTPQLPSANPNGWEALALWDDSLNGGNADGRIDAEDKIFWSLQLWIDANHNGYSEAVELYTLDSLGVVFLDLAYQESPRIDRYGNAFKYSSLAGRTTGGVSIAYDVFFVAQE